MRIIVTGAAGFMGSWLAARLAAAGHAVWALDNGQGGTTVPVGFEIVTTTPGATVQRAFTWNDLGAPYSDLVQHFGAFKPEVLVHLAANAREGASQFQPEAVTRSGLWAYVRTLRACIAAGSLKRVVLFSSMARYGVGEGAPPFEEHYRPLPQDVYAVNKVAMEDVTKALAAVHDFVWSILVPHNVMGPGQAFDRYRNVVTIFVNQIMRGEPLTVFGDGTQRRAFSYIDDSLPCYEAAVVGAADNEVVNVGGRVDININDLLAVIKEYMGVLDHPVVYLADRPLEVKDAWCTTAKSVRLLGYREIVGWREGVRRTCEWARVGGSREWLWEKLELTAPSMPVPGDKP